MSRISLFRGYLPTLRVLVVAFFGIVALGSSSRAGTWYTNPANGHKYTLTSAPMSWNQAEAEAVGLHGHLITIDSSAEENWFWTNFAFSPIEGQLTFANIWIGLTDLGSPNGQWHWVTGEPVTYLNWRPGNPDNIGVEHYVMNFGGSWDNRTAWDQQGADVNGPQRPRYGVIEVGGTPIIHIATLPEPSTILSVGLGIAIGGLALARQRHRSQAAHK
jgi:Lectin C-type domain